jgi:hypothetical protein
MPECRAAGGVLGANMAGGLLLLLLLVSLYVSDLCLSEDSLICVLEAAAD